MGNVETQSDDTRLTPTGWGVAAREPQWREPHGHSTCNARTGRGLCHPGGYQGSQSGGVAGAGLDLAAAAGHGERGELRGLWADAPPSARGSRWGRGACGYSALGGDDPAWPGFLRTPRWPRDCGALRAGGRSGWRVAQGTHGGPSVAPGDARRGGDLALRPAPRLGGAGADAPRDAAPGGTRAPGEPAHRRPARPLQSNRLDSRRPPRRRVERLGVRRRNPTRPRYGGRPCST